MDTFITPPSGGAMLTMSSRNISDLARKRHDSVKRSIVALADEGILTLPQIVETSFLDSKGKTQHTTEYRLEERDSYVVAAKVCPKFMAVVVDEWIELRGGITLHHGAKTNGLNHDGSNLLADLSNRTENALVRLQDATESKVDGLHGHIKSQVTEPLRAFRAYAEERFLKVWERDVKVLNLISTLSQQIGHVLSLASRAVQPDAFVASEWKDIGGVYKVAGKFAPIPRQRALSGQLSRSLDAFCIDTGRQIRNSPWGKPQRVWHVDAVRAWLKDRGARQIAEHLAKHSAQTVIQFPSSTKGEA